MEPSSILIAALPGHVRRPRQPFLSLQHRQGADARIEPHIQNVVFLAKRLAAALRALASGPASSAALLVYQTSDVCSRNSFTIPSRILRSVSGSWHASQ